MNDGSVDFRNALWIFITLTITVSVTLSIDFVLNGSNNTEARALAIFTGLMTFAFSCFCAVASDYNRQMEKESPRAETQCNNFSTDNREVQQRKHSNALVDPLSLGNDPMHKDDLFPPFF